MKMRWNNGEIYPIEAVIERANILRRIRNWHKKYAPEKKYLFITIIKLK